MSATSKHPKLRNDERTTVPDTDRIADSILPLDGPYNPDAVADAAAVIGELVRRLNHAILAHNVADALPYPQDVDRLVGGIATAVNSLPQLMGQLAYRLGHLAGDVRLIVDQRAAEQRPIVVTATAVQHLTDAQGSLFAAAGALARAQICTSRLAWNDED